MKKFIPVFVVVGVIVFLVVSIFGWYSSTYNKAVFLQEDLKSQWGNVESVYQRRADLIPNLVEVVKGYAKHEKETLSAVIEARAKATSVNINPQNLTAQSLQQFQTAQTGLSSALGRLMVVVERYPDLKANENFKDLQSQLEGTENRINVERIRYNESVKRFNSYVRSIPQRWVVGTDEFAKAEAFAAEETAKIAPKVTF